MANHRSHLPDQRRHLLFNHQKQEEVKIPEAGKLFTFREILDIKATAEKLKAFREEDEIPEIGEVVKDFDPVQLEGTGEPGEEPTELYTIFNYDISHEYEHRGTFNAILQTVRIPMQYFVSKGTQYLFIMAGKHLANKVAFELGHIIETDIYEARLTAKTLREYAENSEKTILTFFEDLDLVNADKSAIYAGESGNVAQTDLWGMYLNSGEPGYMMVKERSMQYTVGIGKDCGVTIFNQVDKLDLLHFVQDQVVPMVLKKESQ